LPITNVACENGTIVPRDGLLCLGIYRQCLLTPTDPDAAPTELVACWVRRAINIVLLRSTIAFASFWAPGRDELLLVRNQTATRVLKDNLGRAELVASGYP
jgi:hypothetical protein